MPLPRPETERERAPSGAPAPYDAYGDAIDIAAFVRPLWAARWFLLAAALTGAAVGLTLAWQRPPVYEAIATLLVRRESDAPQQPGTASPALYRSLLEGNTFAGRIISRFHLDQAPYGYSPQTFVSDVLAAEEIRNTDLLRIRIHLTDRVMASDVANAYADMAVEMSQQLASPPSLVEAGRQQAASARDRLQQAEDRLLAFKRSSQLDTAKTDATAALEQRGDILQLIVNIESERARLAAAEAELQKTPSRLSEPRLVSTDTPLFRDLVARRSEPDPVAGRSGADPLAAPRSQSDRLAPQRSDPDPAGERQRAPDPRRRAEPPKASNDGASKVDLSDAYANPVYAVLQYEIAMSRTALAGLERRQRAVVAERHLGGDQLAALSTLYGRQIQLARLQTEYDLAARVYQEVAVRYEQLRLQSDVKATQLVIVDRAVPAEQAMPRGRTRLVITWLLAATLLAVLFVFARHLLGGSRG